MAGLISPATLEQIRSASDIVDIIGGYIPLKRAGANFTALCPFHKEKSPSFNVNPHKQIFHCFGCHKGGDVFSFVKEYENIGFVDAVRRLADRAKIPLEMDNNPHAAESRHVKDQLLQIHDQIAQRWQNCLANEAAGQLARDYLKKRGVSEEAIKLFRIGAAPDSWDDTVNWAKSKGYDLALVEQAGLIIQKSEDRGQKSDAGGATSDLRPLTSASRHHYDRFRGRLMFPICDEQGRVIGFSGRILSGDEKSAKYVNSPETPIFTKSKVFFGLDKSKRAILDAGFAIICEGQLDLIACFMGGVQNIVAPQGTAFTEQHARIIKRYADEVVLCFDSDNAGQNAAVRSLDSLLASGLAVRVAVVPAPHDPDSFIKEHGGEAFKQVIAAAPGFFDFYLGRLCSANDISTEKGRIIVTRSMAEALAKTGDSGTFDIFARKIASILGLPPDSGIRLLRQALKPLKPTVAEEEGSELPSGNVPSWNEYYLLRIITANQYLIGMAKQYLNFDWITNEPTRIILLTIFDNEEVAASILLGKMEDNFTKFLMTTILSESEIIPKPEIQIMDILRHLRNIQISREIKKLNERLSDQQISNEDLETIRLRLGELRQLKRQPLTPLADTH